MYITRRAELAEASVLRSQLQNPIMRPEKLLDEVCVAEELPRLSAGDSLLPVIRVVAGVASWTYPCCE